MNLFSNYDKHIQEQMGCREWNGSWKDSEIKHKTSHFGKILQTSQSFVYWVDLCEKRY